MCQGDFTKKNSLAQTSILEHTYERCKVIYLMTMNLPEETFGIISDGNNDTENFIDLNAQLNLYDENGNIQFDKDRQAARSYFLNHVNPNTVYFSDLEEKVSYLLDRGYYDSDVLGQYSFEFIIDLLKETHRRKYRFPTLISALKFYNQYALKTKDGKRYLERYEDRVVMNGLYLAEGDEQKARDIVDAIITGRFQPATPTFLNAAMKDRGKPISCFLLNMSDTMESISRTITNSLQLSKNGGGVGICVTNLRAQSDPIKGVEGAASGVVPVMKLFEDSFSYANQLGSRQGAGAVYISCHHPDIMRALDTKRENADEKIRIKTLSVGVVVSDRAFDLARKGEDMYLFSPYDIERVYGKPMTEISITEHYDEMVDNPEISKTKINARKFFQTLAELQFESGYPYILFEDTANRFHYIEGNRISYSNLCVTGDTEILTDNGYATMRSLWEEHGKLDIDSSDVIPVDFTVRADGRTLGAQDHAYVDVVATRVVRTAKEVPVYRVRTESGKYLKATEWHKMFKIDEHDNIVKLPLGELEVGDVLLESEDGNFSTSKVAAIDYIGTEDVYDVQAPGKESLIFNGIATGNCSEILQTNELSTFDVKNEYDHVGRDISCNLGSLNVAKTMINGDFGETVATAINALTAVSDQSDVDIVPPVKRGNELSHSVGLGAMNLHGFLGSEKIMYGSDEALDFVNVYFAAMRYHALNASADIAHKRGETFYDFDNSGYKIKDGQKHCEALKNYTEGIWETFPHTERISRLFADHNQWFPQQEDWIELEQKIQETGLYHSYLLAIAPTGSISYVTHSTSSIHPIVAPIEVRKESKLGRVYSPAYGLTNDNMEYYVDAYELGYQAAIDTYAVAQKHIDQAISATLFYNNTAEHKATTRDVNKAHIYAFSRDKVKNEFGEVALYDPRTSWKSGLVKTLYYCRVRTEALVGTEVDNCVSCTI